jgi:hypothetical protein
MSELEKAKKEQLSDVINNLVAKLNDAIHSANDLRLTVTVRQNDKRGIENADVCVSIYELISY